MSEPSTLCCIGDAVRGVLRQDSPPDTFVRVAGFVADIRHDVEGVRYAGVAIAGYDALVWINRTALTVAQRGAMLEPFR